MAGLSEELSERLDALAKDSADLALTELIEARLPETLTLVSLDGLDLRYHPYGGAFKFSVRHADDGQIHQMPNLTDAFVWWQVCKPSLAPASLLDMVASEIQALKLPAEHIQNFILVHVYLQDLALCDF